MPVTPFHLGPGLLVKAALRGRFSLLVFAYSQVLMDIQPLIALTSGHGTVHGWTHTWLGAIVIGLTAGWSGKYAADVALRLAGPHPRVRVRWSVAWVSAAIGTLSHIALDSLMHTDLHPFAPFSDAQPWLEAVSANAVYLGCVYSGAFGALAYLVTRAWTRRRSGASSPNDATD